MKDNSLTSLLGFLDYLATKGLMAKNTAAGRKAACSKVLGILDPEEQTDITVIDIDQTMSRFVNLEGKEYTPSSLAVYKSRVKSAINEFKTYLSNPVSYKPSTSTKKSKTENSKKPTAGQPKKRSAKTPNVQSRNEVSVAPSANVFPIPIRSDVVVRINNLPFDLTSAEADKIASVVKAMALKTN
ncbi:MAG: hypothetical protein V3V15_03745 [Sphingorhabdus sp.]